MVLLTAAVFFLALGAAGHDRERAPASSARFTRDGLVFDEVCLDFEDPSPEVRIEPVEPGDPAAAAAGVAYRGVWPGVDLVLSASRGKIKYEFVVGPGGDPRRILLAWRGVESVALADSGDLVATTDRGEFRDEKPILYQEIDGRRVPVDGHFRLAGESGFGFAVGPYDERLPLVIDPVLSYSTYLGGSADDAALGVALDSSGSAYVTGQTASANFPAAGAYQGTNAGGSDVFVAKLAPGGSSLAYSTFLGGGADDLGSGIAVDSAGGAYVTGLASSADFPVAGAYQATNRGGQYDAFVAKLAPAGSSLGFSTYLGGSGNDSGAGIAVDSAGSPYLTGFTTSTNFPKQSAYQGSLKGLANAFVSKLAASGSTLAYSTYLGGGSLDYGSGIAVDSAGAAFVAGATSSANFPAKTAYQGTNAGGNGDAFVTKLAASGSTLAFSTYLGGTGKDAGSGIAIDSTGASYVTGQTQSANFPTLAPYQGTNAGGANDVFLAKLAAAGSTLAYSTYFGGNGNDSAAGGVAVDSAGSAYLTGSTDSGNFPARSPYQGTNGGGTSDAYVTGFSSSGSALAYSTFLGGSGEDIGGGVAVDPSGVATVAGSTDSANFPTKSAYQGSGAGLKDVAVARLPGRGVGAGSGDPSGDHQDEIGVFRNGMWFMTNSPDYSGVDQVTAFGSPNPGVDSPEIGEFGCVAGGGGRPDGQTDLAVLRKAFSTLQATVSPDWGSAPDLSVTFGTTDHKRIPVRRLDTNGDGCSDIGVFRNGCFDVIESPGYGAVATHVCFGLGTDDPLAADLNGDGRSDLILWRAVSSHYTYRLSPGYSADQGADLGGGDVPILGEMNGDGRTDLGSYKPLFSTFRFTYSPDFAGVDLVKTHGMNGDLPVVAEANGDGVSDIGIFRGALARWWFLCSPGWTATCVSQSFGMSGDVPIYGKPAGMP